MAWLADKARNLLSKGKGAEPGPPVDSGIPSGAKATYRDQRPDMPLESGRLIPLDSAYEQVRRDPEMKAMMEKAGLPESFEDLLAEDSGIDTTRRRGQGPTTEEHRLLNVCVLLGNGDAKYRGGFYNSAEATYREAYRAAINVRDKLLQAVSLAVLAAAVAMQDKHEQALKHIEDALRRKSDLAVAWYNRGVILLMLVQYSEALSCFDEALLHRPVFAEAQYNKGVALGNLNRPSEALTCFETALNDDPQDAEAWLGKGVSLLMLVRYGEAVDCFEEALKNKFTSAGAWLGKGLGLVMLGRCEEAMPCFDQALGYQPDLAEAWLGKGQALGELGRHKEAADSFEKALHYRPDSAHTWHIKGVALEKLGLFKQALVAYERARSLEKGQR
jgi:tetratricopeptide (TPR) repeat protein